MRVDKQVQPPQSPTITEKTFTVLHFSSRVYKEFSSACVGYLYVFYES